MNTNTATRTALTTRRIALAALLASATLLLASTTTAIGAANGVPASKVTVSVRPIGPNDLKPPQCASLTLTTLVIGATGTNAADLQLGTPAADNLNGKAGNDCIIGGAGDDTINGGGGADICIGGPGTDTSQTAPPATNNPTTAQTRIDCLMSRYSGELSATWWRIIRHIAEPCRT